MESLSFDPMVELYDETRSVDAACLDAALDYIAARFPSCEYPAVVEPGIGTGRIAIPLAHRGYRVAGVDIAPEMLAMLAQRLREAGQTLAVTYQQGDATQLPYADDAFDLAIVCHLFYFIPDWRRAVTEVLRVTRAGGALILVQSGRGREVSFLSRRYQELSGALGYVTRFRGAKSTGEVVEYAEGEGYAAERLSGRWHWMSQQRLGEALNYYQRRAYSYTSLPPDEAHRAIMDQLTAEAIAHYGSLDSEIVSPDEMYLVVLTQKGAARS